MKMGPQWHPRAPRRSYMHRPARRVRASTKCSPPPHRAGEWSDGPQGESEGGKLRAMLCPQFGCPPSIQTNSGSNFFYSIHTQQKALKLKKDLVERKNWSTKHQWKESVLEPVWLNPIQSQEPTFRFSFCCSIYPRKTTNKSFAGSHYQRYLYVWEIACQTPHKSGSSKDKTATA